MHTDSKLRYKIVRCKLPVAQVTLISLPLLSVLVSIHQYQFAISAEETRLAHITTRLPHIVDGHRLWLQPPYPLMLPHPAIEDTALCLQKFTCAVV